MAAWDNIADICRWWTEELRELAEMRLDMPAGGEKPPKKWRIVLSRDGLAVTSAIHGEPTPVADEGGLAVLSTFDWRVRHRSRPRAEIVLGEGRFLVRPLATFRLPRSRARAMARLDLDTATPLDPESLLVMFPRRGPEAAGERYVVARRDHVVPVRIGTPYIPLTHTRLS